MTTMPTKRPVPPVIEEIAKAYQNDPRTRIAQQAMQAGTSGAPVAGGDWAVADGLARVLQAGIGGFVDKRQQKQYGADEAALIAERMKRGQAGLEGIANQTAATMAPQAPAPQMAPQAPPAIQNVDIPPSMAPQAPPVSYAPSAAPAGQIRPGPGLSPPPSQGGQPGWLDPLGGEGRPTSGYGPRSRPVAGASTMHNGQDYAAPQGSPVGAAGDGTVIRAWKDPKGGNSVLVRHPDGSVTGYAHLEGYNVQRGDPVSAGQQIGTVGSTGVSTGNHLHFTYRDPSGKRQNPSTIKFGASPTQPTLDASAPRQAEQVGTAVPPAETMPVAPNAEPATQSLSLRQAYEMMAGGNRYEANDAQDMLKTGMAEQGRFNESASGRKQDISNTGYQAALGRYGNDRSQDRSAAYGAQSDQRRNSYDVAAREDGQAFQAGEAQKNRDFEASQFDKRMAAEIAQLERRAEIARGTKDEQRVAKQAAWLQTPQGQRAFKDYSDAASAAETAAAKVDEFMEINANKRTGGALLAGPLGGAVTWANNDLQRMEQISNELVLSANSGLKGATSDKDIAFLRGAVPSITRGGRANQAGAAALKRALTRKAEYERIRFEASQDNNPQLMRDFQKYANEVSIRGDGPTFEEWQRAPTLQKGRRK